MRRSRDIQRVQRHGRRIRLPNLMVLFSVGSPDSLRVAFTVSRKVGNAVVRNRVKRWLRESIRHQLDHIPCGFDIVVIAHPQAATLGVNGIAGDLNAAWHRMSEGRA